MHEELLQRVEFYARRNGLQLGEYLGSGVHGLVYFAQKSGKPQAAVKIHKYRESYVIEMESYQRLKVAQVSEVCGFAVPQLIAWDHELLAIEMSVVAKPYLLDFASVAFDQRLEFSDDVRQTWEEDMREKFEARWPLVQKVVDALTLWGIYLTDISPSNIAFE